MSFFRSRMLRVRAVTHVRPSMLGSERLLEVSQVVLTVAHEQAYQILRDRILRGHQGYELGARLQLNAIAVQFGVSITPIKDALRRLANEGLVVLEPRRGTFVATLSEADIEEIVRVREGLDRLAFDLRARRSGRVEDGGIERSLENWRNVIGRNDVPEAAKAHYEFHQALVALSGNSVLVDLHEHLLLRAAVYIAANANAQLLMLPELDVHLDMGRAMVAGDRHSFERSVREHYQRARGVKRRVRDSKSGRDEREGPESDGASKVEVA